MRAANGLLRDRRFGRLWQDKTPVEELEPFNLLHRNQMMENEPPTTPGCGHSSRRRSRAATSSGCGPACSPLADALLDDVDLAAAST